MFSLRDEEDDAYDFNVGPSTLAAPGNSRLAELHVVVLYRHCETTSRVNF